MKTEHLRLRAAQFSLRVIRMLEFLPRKMTADVLGRQLLRSATAVAANYRAACRARSRADFVAKMGIVEEETDESGLWLELISQAGLMSAARLRELAEEAHQLTAIAVSSIRTARLGSGIPHSALRTLPST